MGAPFSLQPAATAVVALLPGVSDEALDGAQQPVPTSAPRFDHMLAMSGRDPGWRPQGV